MVNLPADPGEALWIGAAAGKNHFNIGIGGPNGGTDHTDYGQDLIEDGFEQDPEFVLNSDGDIQFRMFVENGRTSSGTKYPRSELRELQQNGTTKAAWDGRSGVHYMQGRSRIDTAPSAKPWVVFCQVHDAESDLARVQLEDGAIVCRRSPANTSSEIRTVLRSGYSFGTWIAWELRIESGRFTVKLDGEVVLDVSNMGKTGCYFKTGCYNQVSSADDGGGATPGEYCQVTMERGSLVTWHSGYPTPTTPVFTGSTDTTGGAGNDADGNDTQAPTAPTGLTTVPEGSAIRLTWNASTDNVGVDHYNVYRFATDAVGGGTTGGTTYELGKTTAGTATNTSTNDKIIGSVATASAGGTLAAGHARVWLSASGSTSSRLLVYADDGGAPGALLATSDEITITATSESTRDYVFSGAEQITIENGVDYWVIVAWDDPGAINIEYGRDQNSSKMWERSDITYGTFPDPFGTETEISSGPLAAWVEFVSGGSPGAGGSTSSFGKQTDGASTTSSSTDKMIVSAATASADGTLTAGHARVWLDGADTVPTKCVVYADSGGAPGALLAESDEENVTGTSEAEVDYTFSGAEQISITDGTTYWIGLAWQDPGSVSIVYSRDGTSSQRQEVSGFTYPTLPDPFGTPSSGSGPIDVYLDTTSGAGGASGGFVLIGTTKLTTYLDEDVETQTAGTLGVGGIAAPAAGPGVVLVTDDSSDRLEISTDNVTYDGGGHSVAGITIEADGVTVQNFVIHGCDRDAVAITGANVTVQNCDIYDISDDGTGDINCFTIFGDGIKILNNTAGVTDFVVTGDPGGSHTDFVQTWNTSSKRSTSNLIVQGNRVVGPAVTDDRFIHQGVQGEGSESSDGGGGGDGTSSGWIIADNSFEFDCENQVLNFLDIHDVEITRNTFAGEANNVVGTGDGSDGIVFYDDNVITGTYNNTPSETAGPGPDGVTGTPAGGTPVEYVYQVTAEDAAGNESGAAGDGGSTGGGTSGTVTPDDTIAPTVPTNLTATVDDRRVSLTWDVSIDDDTGVDEYYVYRDSVFWTRTATPEYVDTDVVNGTQYSYTVSALDRAGNESDESAAVLATPAAVALGGIPLLPGVLVTGQRVNVGKIEVCAAWGADLADDQSTWTWTDITTDVRQDPGISTSLGRNDESSSSNPAALTLQLDNTSGDYSLGGLSANYPYVRRNTPVRVRIDPGDGAGGRVLFLGFADGWSPGWDLTGTVPVVTLSASGSLRRMSQGDAPLMSAYRRAMTALDSVVAYWPMEEGSAARFAPAVRGGTDMALSGRPDWGADDNLECSAPLPVLKDGHFSADVFPYAASGKVQVRFLLSIPSDGLDDGIVLFRISTTGSIGRWDITYELVDSKDNLGIYSYNASDGSLNSSNIINFDVNDKPGRVTLALIQSGSNIAWTLSVKDDDPDNILAYTFSGTVASHTVGIVTRVDVNPNGSQVEAAIGHVTVEDTITSLFEANEALQAHTGEIATGTAGRIFRLCSENGVPLQTYGAPGPGSSVADELGPQLVAPLLDLLAECEASDQGQLWDGRSAGLSYSTRRRRELGTVRLTVDAAAGELAEGFEPVDDDQRNRNRMTVSRTQGITVSHEDEDGPLGTAAIGIYDDSAEINNRRDEMMAQYATWLVHLGTVEGYRYPSVTVDLAATPSLAGEVLDIVPGERLDVVNLDDTLAGFPHDSVSLIVEGISHEVTPRTWRATFQCSPASPWLVGEVAEDSSDTTELAWRLDTDGSTLDSSAAAGATSIDVATSSGALWTVDSEDYPLYLNVGGLKVRATACTGPSAPAATFTSDAYDQPFIDSGALASTYHVYAAGLPASGAGLLLHFHGDGAYEYDNPADEYALGGNRGIPTVARAKGYITVVVKAPDTTGDVTWWEAGARNADYVAELLADLTSTYSIDTSKIWLMGYSGGAQFITQYFVPEYGTSLLEDGGGALILGGGGTYAGTPTFSAALKANFPMHWWTGQLDDGTFVADSYDALTDAQDGSAQYAGQGFATTLTSPSGMGHELDGSFGELLDEVLPALTGFEPLDDTPGATRPTLVASYIDADTGTTTTSTTTFTPDAGEVIVVKTWAQDLDNPNFATCTGAGLSFGIRQHVQAASHCEVMIFVAELGDTTPEPTTVTVTWQDTAGDHGMIVERWRNAQVAGTPEVASPITGTDTAPSATLTPTTDHSVITWINADWDVTAGTAAYRSNAVETQTSSTTNVRAYAAYQGPTSTAAQTVGMTAPAGQTWSLAAIELLPASDAEPAAASPSVQTFTVDALPAARSSAATVALWDPRPIGLG